MRDIASDVASEPALPSLGQLGVSYDEGGESLGDPSQVAQVRPQQCDVLLLMSDTDYVNLCILLLMFDTDDCRVSLVYWRSRPEGWRFRTKK